MSDRCQDGGTCGMGGYCKDCPNVSASGSNDLLCVRIDSFSSLKGGWDSYEGKAVHPVAIDLAKEIAVKLAGMGLQAVPTPDGGVQLEAHFNNVDIEIDVNVSDA